MSQQVKSFVNDLRVEPNGVWSGTLTSPGGGGRENLENTRDLT